MVALSVPVTHAFAGQAVRNNNAPRARKGLRVRRADAKVCILPSKVDLASTWRLYMSVFSTPSFVAAILVFIFPRAGCCAGKIHHAPPTNHSKGEYLHLPKGCLHAFRKVNTRDKVNDAVELGLCISVAWDLVYAKVPW